jgi:ankyrin repeat protein
MRLQNPPLGIQALLAIFSAILCSAITVKADPATQPSTQPSADPKLSVSDVSVIRDAANRGDWEKIKAILNDNPDLVFSKDDDGKTPMHYASTQGQKDVVEFLLAHKADVNARDNDGGTPLYYAAKYGNKEVVELLLANKAEVDAKNNDGETPLYAAASSREYTVEESGVTPANGVDLSNAQSGSTVPGYMSQRLSEKEYPSARDVAGILLAKGADANVKDKAGKTPLDEAVSCGNKGVAEVLRQHGGNENVNGMQVTTRP